MKAGLLRSRDVRLIVGAVGISALGDFLLWIPLTLHLQAKTDSGIAVAALFVALWAPVVILAPVAGLIVDRREARGVLLVASLAQVAIAASMAVALDSVAAILVLAALLGIGFAVAQPAEFSLVPLIGGEDRLTEINGLVETARYSGMTVGPVLGGLLAGLGGTKVAMLVNAGTFGAVALAALLLRTRREPRPPEVGAEPERARDGAVYLFRDRTLGLVMAVVFVSLLFMTASATAEVFFIKQDLGASDAVYGLLFGAWTIGMVAGALVVARRVPTSALALAVLIAVGVQGAGLGLPTAWLAIGFGAAMWFIGGLGHGTKNVLARTLIQQRVPGRLHGRAFAAYNGLRNGAELFALAAGGVLVATIGGRATLALAGAIPVVAALVGLALFARLGPGPTPPGSSSRSRRSRTSGCPARPARRLAPERGDEVTSFSLVAGSSRQALVRDPWLRLRVRAWPILQTAAAAVGSWYLAKLLLPEQQPVFASIAAVISLGATYGQRSERAIELVGGVVLGIGVADLLVRAIGTGPAQIGVMVLLAMSAAVILGGGPLLVTEAAVSAILLVVLEPTSTGLAGSRVIDALVGGGVALGVSALAFPPDPVLLVRRSAQGVFSSLGRTLEEVGAALSEGDSARADAALRRPATSMRTFARSTRPWPWGAIRPASRSPGAPRARSSTATSEARGTSTSR